ncbi:AraC family transcriptional regulator [Paenibacillus sp. FJAT-26967]|uniref:helix-turn-helix domain-containing protein n=1 Tax=Paenibacillus sp. FJAT-26967 TaxID=1729690 RepID=UPI0008382133|nr:AraC family transcriptional regulator [Paenibacillus sp. FJAT-26967]
MLTIRDIRHDRGTDWYVDNTSVAEQEVALILVTYGKCIYWIEGDKVILEKGDLLLLPSSLAFYAKSIPTILHDKYVLTLRLDQPLALPLLNLTSWITMKTGMLEFVLERVRRAYTEWLEKDAYADIRSSAIVTEVIALLNREHDNGPVTPQIEKHAQRMKLYIQTNYREKVTKEELGACISTSPNYAAMLFRRVTGQTISDYVHSVRIKKAVYMLIDSLLTVSEIAEFLGYQDVSYFQRVFKKMTGKTPSAYTKERNHRK